MIRRNFILLLLFTCSMLISAQVNSLRNEIINYKDSTQEFINNGRKMLISKLKDGDVESIKQIKNTLLLEENENYMVFYPVEMKLLLYYTGEYDELKSYLITLDDDKIRALKLKNQPNEDLLYYNLINYIRNNLSVVENKIKDNVINSEDRDFLIMDMHYLVGGKDYPKVTRETLNDEADNFLSLYPKSNYEPYIRENIRYKMVVSPWGYGFEFFSGYGHGTSDLSDKLGGHVPLGVAFDIIYKKWTLYLRDYIGIGTTRENILIGSEIWPKGKRADVFFPEASLGYTLPLKSPLMLTPFAGVVGLMIAPGSADENESFYDEANELNSFAWTLGLNLDIKLGRYSSSMPLVSYNESAYWFLRIRYGYVMSTLSNHFNGFDGNFHYLTIGIGGIGHKIKRDI